MKKLLMFLLAGTILSGCVTTGLSTMQRRGIESRDLEGRFEDAYKSTIQVFQDNGYTIKNSDYQSGIIQGETGVKKDWLFMMTSFELTATIEQFGENTVKERLSLVKKVKSNSKYGVQEDSQVITDPQLFQKLYEDIQKEMFIRRNLNK